MSATARSTFVPVPITTDNGTSTLDVEIATVMPRQGSGLLTATRHGLFAQVKVATPTTRVPHGVTTYSASRLEGERQWIVDATFLPSGRPLHVNGFGVRFLNVRALPAEIGALLDQEAVRLGLVQSADADTPLTLPPRG
ncbi:hypothetical protein ACIQF6_35740 [Kitasatospora sp. NPDC092948]|uniref:hypothetical protein n=1 Tax=Kitasatospora sp. NPDC092948 TaxID=3364088 RepID=UPI0038086E20